MRPSIDHGIGKSLRRLHGTAQHVTYTSWSRLGRVSMAAARWMAPADPPVLILSLPRSGSSWLGAILGGADDALYLREPVNDERRRAGEAHTLVDVDPGAPPEIYRRASDAAFAGVPAFRRGVVRYPAQWTPRGRRRRRVVVKEVNPLACAFWLDRYRPRVIYLVRHPAAVALSYQKLGWLENADVQMAHDDASRTCWEKNGMRQGFVHRAALRALEGHDAYRVVSYEELCRAPLETFRQLFAFAGLAWSERTEQAVRRHSTAGDARQPYGTHRDSGRMACAWEGRLEASDLQALWTGYRRYALPWYARPQDWGTPEEVPQ